MTELLLPSCACGEVALAQVRGTWRLTGTEEDRDSALIRVLLSVGRDERIATPSGVGDSGLELELSRAGNVV